MEGGLRRSCSDIFFVQPHFRRNHRSKWLPDPVVVFQALNPWHQVFDRVAVRLLLFKSLTGLALVGNLGLWHSRLTPLPLNYLGGRLPVAQVVDAGWLRSVQATCYSVSQGRICSDNSTCYHTKIEVADQTYNLTQSRYTDTGPASPGADPKTAGGLTFSPSHGILTPGQPVPVLTLKRQADYLTQSRYTDTEPTSPVADPKTAGGLSHPVTVYWHRANQSQCWP